MDSSFLTITNLLVIVTVVVSWHVFNRPDLREKMVFSPYAVRKAGDYYRFVSSGFIHADWLHLLFNMFALYSFGNVVEAYYKVIFGEMGNLMYLLLYLGGMVMADAYTYYKLKDYSHYRSLGASGAVSGIVLSFILFQPLSQILVFFIPMPAVLAGLLYMGYSYYASLKGTDNVAHEAHFFGGLFGILFTLVFRPSIGQHFWQQLFGTSI